MAKKVDSGLTSALPVKKTHLDEREWAAAFLDALAKDGNVTAACKKAYIARRTVYVWRSQNSDFAEAWDDAIDESIDAVEAECRRRLMGEGDKGKGSDILLMFWLKAHRPEKYRDWYDASKVVAALTAQVGQTPNRPPPAIDVEHKQIERAEV